MNTDVDICPGSYLVHGTVTQRDAFGNDARGRCVTCGREFTLVGYRSQWPHQHKARPPAPAKAQP